eukprot:Skav217869  [mRNA]  locus=scaffold2487:75358:81453:+ [translate_table: standard]
MFVQSAALQLYDPFAQFFTASSAVSTDRDYGSGDTELLLSCHFGCETFFDQGGCSDLVASPSARSTIRYGEALHPGPHGGDLLTVGVSNPGGLRQKEEHLLDLGPGIWSLAETQLSAVTFRTCSGLLRKLGQQRNRAIRFHGGSPAPLRTGSTWAGKWTGVAVLSDVQAQQLDIPWPDEHWATGRLMMTRHWANGLPITIGTVYGYAKGPTWPKARQLTDQLLETFTTEMVIGIVEDDFAEHSTIKMHLRIPSKVQTIQQWPRPSEIPWGALDCQDWAPTCTVQMGDYVDSTQFLQDWARAYESSVFELARDQASPLPPRCRGRAQRHEPVTRQLTAPVSKPSREGEVRPMSSLAGTALRNWFKQLRRLQSLKHAVIAAKQTQNAINYRQALWHSIRTSNEWCPDNVELPHCTLHHLLVPRQQLLVQWRQELRAHSSQAVQFMVSPGDPGFHHLFLDGSCFHHVHSVLNLAAWAVVDATTGQLLAAAPLDGHTQSIDRAELTSMVMALEWASEAELDLALWSDSHSTVTTADAIIQTGSLPPGLANLDLWTQFKQLLDDRSHRTTWIRWVPSHLDPELAEDEFEAWLIRWNDVADQAARHANSQRPSALWSLRDRVARRLDDWALRLRQLRQFYFSVADLTADQSATAPTPAVVPVEDSDEDWMWLPWEDCLPLDWPSRCVDVGPLPCDFLRALVIWICAAERLGGTANEALEDLVSSAPAPLGRLMAKGQRLSRRETLCRAVQGFLSPPGSSAAAR